jgi:hypothetical protein
LQGKSDDFLLFLNDISEINKMWGFFSPSVQKTLAFYCNGGGRGGEQSLLAIPRRFG